MTLGAALRRYPILALLPVMILAAAGVTLGLRRPPTYTASTQLNVGAPDISSQATPGYAQAAQTLASAYSREVTSQFVFKPVATKLGIPVGTLPSRLTSAAVPDSPTFTINATGSSTAAALTLARAATSALEHRINVLDQGENASTHLLTQYRRQQQLADQLTSASGKLQGRNAAGVGPPVSPSRLLGAKVSAQVAQLAAQALANQYTTAATASRGAIIEVLNPATTATSNRRSITERYGLIGAAAGIVIGAALALLVASIRTRGRWAPDVPL